jgi:hypothetical protein
LAIAATALVVTVARSNVLPARDDDAAPKAHEAVVLDRIFANWKARNDRVRSFHFTYDCRTTYRKGRLDLSREPRAKLDHDQAFDQFGVQLWVDGDDRMCSLVTPSFKVPGVELTDTRRNVARFVIVGNTAYTHYSASWWKTGRPLSPPFAPYGLLYQAPIADARSPIYSFQALSLTFRSQPPSLFLPQDECRLVDENAVVDNGHYVEFRRNGSSDATLWVSPAREDVVVHWTTRSQGTSAEGSIKYKRDDRYGWIPAEWTCDYLGHMLEESKMTAYSINEKIDPAVFSLEFPAGTPVEDSREAKSLETIRHYVVESAGSNRLISHDEFNRLAHLGNPIKPPVPAKRQAK